MGGAAVDPVQGLDAVGDDRYDAGPDDAFEDELVEVRSQDRVDAAGADKLAQAEVSPVDPRACFGRAADDLPLLARIREVPLEQLAVHRGPLDPSVEMPLFFQPGQCIVGGVEVALPVAVVVGKLDNALPGDLVAQRYAGRLGAARSDEEGDATPFDLPLASPGPLDGLDDLANLSNSGLARSAEPRLRI